MKKLILVMFIAAAQCFAQSTGNPLIASSKAIYGISKNDVLKSAEEMPEADYSFKPAATVRTFGELVAHVADAQYEFCSVIVGDGKKGPGVEKNKTSKADIIQSLKEAYAYCDNAYSGITDANAAEMVKFAGFNATKLSILDFNTAHNMEHYGNIVTYLRIKGFVPPSSKQ